ncbi:MAG: hypothetical protein PVI30_12320 [Myxococcales bacterium]|jgi:hypothetical protein
MRRRSPWSRVGPLALVAALGCAAESAERPGAVTAADAAEARPPEPPPIPTDLFQVLPAGARQVARVDGAALRRAGIFGKLDVWARRQLCVSPSEPDHWLLRRTDAVLLASYRPAQPTQARPALLAVAKGRYRPEDASRALAAAGRLLPGADGGEAEAGRGRFRVARRGTLAAVVLSGELLLVGDLEAVHGVLDRLDAQAGTPGRGPALADDAALDELGGRARLTGRTVVMLGQADAETVQRLSSAVRGLGAGGATRGLAPGPLVAEASFERGLSLQLRAPYADGGAATAAARKLRSLFAQTNLIFRLTGMPPLLDRVVMQPQPGALKLSLAVGEGDLQRLASRVDLMIRASDPGCPPAGPSRASRLPGSSPRPPLRVAGGGGL